MHRRAAREALAVSMAVFLGLPALAMAPFVWGVWFYAAMLASLAAVLVLIARKHGAGRPESKPYWVAVASLAAASAYFLWKGVPFVRASVEAGQPTAMYLLLMLASLLAYALLLAGVGLRIWQVRDALWRRLTLAGAGVAGLGVVVPLGLMSTNRLPVAPLTTRIPFSDTVVLGLVWLAYLGNLLLIYFLYRSTRPIKVAIVGPPGVGKTQILMRLGGLGERSMESTQVATDITVVPRGYNRYMLPIRSRDVPGEDTDAWVSLLAQTQIDGLVLVLAPPDTEAQQGQWSRFLDEFLDGYRRYSPRQPKLKHILVMVNKQDQWADGQEPMDVIWPFVARLDQLEIRNRRVHVKGSCAYSPGGESVNVITVINNYIDDYL